jgi:hypothetical protein
VLTYLVERYLPGASAKELAAAAARAEEVAVEMRAEGIRVAYLGSVLVPLDEMCFHLFQGPSLHAVKEAKLRARISFERMTPAIFAPPERPFRQPADGRLATSATDLSTPRLARPRSNQATLPWVFRDDQCDEENAAY